MTEREKDLLEDLLTTSPEGVDDAMQEAHRAKVYSQPDELTPRDEKALLRAANAVGPVTLTDDTAEGQHGEMSLLEDVTGFVKRYPIPTALAVAGAAYLFARRRK